MARPERRDVDYFPFYVKDGKTLFILESKYGCKGTGFFTNVMRLLCRTPDHHLQIKTTSDRIYFFAQVKCDEETGVDMLNIMSETGKLHPELWVSASVIFSQSLLDSIADAYKKRINPMITVDEVIQKYLKPSPETPVSPDGNTQTKGKDRIGKERIKKSIVRYDYEKNTWEGITDEMIARWVDRFPALDIQQELNKMATWLDTHRKNKKTDFDKFIGNWLIRNQDRAKPQQSTDTLGGFRD